MTDLNREVAGLQCREVLALLGDYVDGALSPQQAEQVESHLRGCDHCEKFGGEYSSLVAQLRSRLAQLPLGAEAQTRVVDRLQEMWAAEEG